MKELTSGRQELGPEAHYETPAEEIERLLKENQELKHKLVWAGLEYQKLNEIYTKLADQWNAFQATAKPDNRNVHRAEAAGELARKLAECLIGLAYDKDARKGLVAVLTAFLVGQEDVQHVALSGRAPDDVAK